MNEAEKKYEIALRDMADPGVATNMFGYEAGLKLMTMTREQRCLMFAHAVTAAEDSELDEIIQCMYNPRNYDAEVGSLTGRVLARYMRPFIVADYHLYAADMQRIRLTRLIAMQIRPIKEIKEMMK